jgi:hypothetical protein
VPKEYSLLRHYGTVHKRFGLLDGKLREDKFYIPKWDLKQQHKVFTVADKSSEASFYLRFTLPNIFGKRSKPFTDDDFVKEFILKATEILCPEKQQLSKSVSHYANTVADRINDLAGDIQYQLTGKCKDTVAYPITTGESTDIMDIVMLAVVT